MSSSHPLRSSSVGALPRERRHTTSRAESSCAALLDVRCGCQFFQCDSLLPDRINPVDSRPGSSIGYASDVNIIQLERPGLHNVANRSFVAAMPAPPPEPDKISTKSFAMGQNKPKSFDQMSIRSFGIERQPAFDQISNKGLVVRNISDADDGPIGIPSWQNKPAADRVSVRSFGSHTHISRRDADNVSVRSFGLKRISRSPSHSELYVAEIEVPSLGGSRRGSKMGLPQFNIIAATPTMEPRFSYGDHYQTPNAGSQNKENKNFSAYEDHAPSKYKPSEQFAFLLEYPIPEKQRKIADEPQQMDISEDNAAKPAATKSENEFSAILSQRIQRVHELEYEQPAVDSKPVLSKPQSFEMNIHAEESSELDIMSNEPKQSEMIDIKDHSTKRFNVAREIANLGPKMKSMAEHLIHIADKKSQPGLNIRFRAEDLPQYQPARKQDQDMTTMVSETQSSIIQKEKIPPQLDTNENTMSFEQDNYQIDRYDYGEKEHDIDQYLIPIIDKSVRAPPPPPEEWCAPSKPYDVKEEGPRDIDMPSQEHHQTFKRNEIVRPPISLSPPPDNTAHPSMPEEKFPSASVMHTASPPQLINFPEKSTVALVKATEAIMSGTAKSPEPEPLIPFRADDLPQYCLSKAEPYSSTSLPRAASESGSQRQLDQKMLRSNLLRRKMYFTRTQSQDRAPSFGGSISDMRSNRMTKTVSFDFETKPEIQQTSDSGRISRSRDKSDWLEETYLSRDHEYEPIGQPLDDVNQLRMDVDKESSPIPTFQISEPPVDDKTMGAAGEPSGLTSDEQKELDGMLPDDDEEHIPTALEQQLEIEERYFSSVPTTPRTDSRTDNEIHTSQVDSSALEELPLKAENRRKGFMASAHDRSRKMSENIRSQAGKIRTKIRGTKKVPAEGSPKAKDRKRFKKPDFSKIKMPEIKRPDLSKFKPPEMPKFKSPEFKRPEFTKFDKPIFTKPDLSKFKIPDTMAIKLRRTRSLKETEVPSATEATDVTPESAEATPKKKFEFNFGTYPRMLRKRKQKVSTIVIAKADDLPSTESPQSVESTPLPRQEGGPVSPRWTDKFSEVSYGDSESGKYQRYGSEVESLGRESSMERRMKEDLERSAREQEELEIIHSVEQKQFADFDEENRAIHEISRSREGEFKKRRPMVHQDSDLVSEESKDVGWSEKDALRNAILKGADEQDADHLQPEKYESEEALGSSMTNTNQETQSTASSGTRQKGVIEEIDDDEFILRKRGISQDNIEIRQYISDAIREGLTTPRNTLAQLADKESYFMDVSNEQVNYGYDVPPPKPKRAIKNLNNFDQNRDTGSREISQEYQRERRDSFDDNTSLPHDTEGYFANIPPNRPLRRSRKNFHRDENHEVPSGDIPYFDDEEDNLLFKKINIDAYKQRQDDEDQDVVPVELFKPATPPKAPKRRRKQQRGSIEKDSYANRFAGRSVSNSFLPSEERDEDFIVYRTQHEYIIPLAQAETFTSTPTPAPRRSRSRSQSHMTDDDRTSRGAESLMSESIQLEEEKFHIDMKDNDGYATVRKEPPPRPPAPRRHRKPSPLPDKHFATMPHLKKESSHDQTNRRRFGTIGPSRPPRRKSSASMEDSQNSPDVTQYEELDIDIENEEPDLENRIESPRGDLHSGDVVNKMKFRPLPPPPRPPRETRRRERRDPKDGFDDKQDKDDGAEMIACDLHLNGDYDDEKYMEKCIEVEASTQTDPLPDDFCCEEFEITDDMRVIEPRVGRTLQDILREDQHAQPDESFAKSIQRFREAGQRSFSERSKGSTADRSRTSYGSRPTTPSAIVLEKRVPTPIPGTHGETMLEAALVVLPIDDVDVGAVGNEVVSDPIKITQEDFNKEDDVRSEEEKSEDYLQEEESRLITDHLLVEYETVQDSAEEQREISLTRDESPPVAPPRKRSSITTEQSPPMELVQPSTQTAFLPTTLEVVPQSDQQIERTVPLPSRLTLTDLEVERLNVHELQAGSITVSQLQSSMVKTDELECRSSNVAQPLEIPPGLIDEIVKRVLSSERASETVQTQTTEQPLEYHESQVQPATPGTPPPPGPPPPDAQTHPANLTSESMQYSIPPSSFYTLRDPPEVELPQTPTHRRRRHHRRRDSSSDDESYREQRRSRHGTRSPEPSIGQLSGQLLQACGSSVMQSLNQIVGILRANEKEGNDRNISTAIALVIFVTIGFLLLGISGTKNIHHHHWDYFNPPDNKGR